MKGALTRGLYQLSCSSPPSQSTGADVCLIQANPSATQANPSATLSCNSSSQCNVSPVPNLHKCSTADISNKISSQLCSIANDDLSVWHNKLGHPNHATFATIFKHLTGKTLKQSSGFCDACSQGKIHQKAHISSVTTTHRAFQLIHSDIWGPAYIPSSQGYKYYLSFVDDYTRYTWLYPLTLKSETTRSVKHFIAMVKSQFKIEVEKFQSDWGGEFRPLVDYFKDLGIHFQHPCPHIHAQNGKIERKHQHIVETGLTLLAQAHMPLKFWWEAFLTAVHLINFLPSSTLYNSCPHSLLYNVLPDYTKLKVFGCTCFPYLRPYNKHKLQLRSQKCVFLGYSANHKGFKCLSSTGRLYIADSVLFNEKEFPYTSLFPTAVSTSSSSPSQSTIFYGPTFSIPAADSTNHFSSTDENTSSSSSPSTSSPPSKDMSSASHLQTTSSSTIIPNPSATHPNNTHTMITRSKAGISTSKVFSAINSSKIISSSSSPPANPPANPLPSLPTSYKAALKDKDWFNTMDLENAALKTKTTWFLVPPDPSQKLITNKWVFRVKTKADGTLDKLKARLVARGFEQLAGIDYLETFSPVVKFSTIRLVFALAATRGWLIQQIDINNAFLNGDLEETIYMTQPKGFEDPLYPHYVCKLNKSIYGLKQAPRAWYDKLKNCLLNLGFQRSTSDFSLFFKKSGSDLMLVLVYVDDILLTGDSQKQILDVINLLNAQFALKHPGLVSYFLGLEVTHKNKCYHLTQSQYILELLDKNDLTDCNPCATPMCSSLKLSKDQGIPLTNPTPYRSTVGALQYLTLTRPDIAFAVNKLSQFLQNPTDIHWNACKHLLRYLKGTHSFALSFSPSSSLLFSGFADADWASCVDDTRSTGGHCIYLGDNLIVWNAKKQSVVSRSSAESEYRALANATVDLIWLHSLCGELGISVTIPSKIWSDNKSALALASNPVFHARTKHVEIDVHFVREKVQSKVVEVGYVPSEDQVADLFTKALPEAVFLRLRQKINLGG